MNKLFAILFSFSCLGNLNAISIPQDDHLYFLENKGQIRYQDGTPANDIKYSMFAGNMRIDIKSNSIHYTLIDNKFNDPVMSSLALNKRKGNHDIIESIYYRVDVDLLGSNIDNVIVADGKMNYYENYYLDGCGNNGVKGVYAYKQVTIKDIYKGIDWKIYIDNNSLKYDFIVHSGANPDQIKLKYSGAEQLMLDNESGLVIKTPQGEFNEKKPYSFEMETGKKINSSYHLADNILSYKLDSYTGTLIIDPQLEWCSYYGGSFGDWVSQIKVVSNDYLCMVGYTSSKQNIASTGAHQTVIGGGTYDAFIVFFDEFGVRKWSTYMGGSGTDEFIEVQYYNNEIILGGITSSKSNISTPDAFQPTFGGGVSDCLLAKFDITGHRIWSTYFGGEDIDGTYPGDPAFGSMDIKVNGSGDIYICGATASQSFVATDGTFSHVYNGGKSDGFLAKFDNEGKRIWGTYFGGSNEETPYNLCVDLNENIYIAGETYSINNISTPGTHQQIFGGMFDTFITKFDPNGQRLWGTYFGGLKHEYCSIIKVDSENNIYFAGSTSSIASIAWLSAFQSSFGGYDDGYLQKFNPDGQRIWGTYFGGSAGEYILGLEIDRDDNIIFTGGITGLFSRVVKGNAIQTTSKGDFEIFIEKFNKAGKQIWGTYYGGTGNDRAWDISVNSIGDFYVTGSTNSLIGIATENVHQSTYGGGTADVFIAKISDETLKVKDPLQTILTNAYPNPATGVFHFDKEFDLNKFLST